MPSEVMAILGVPIGKWLGNDPAGARVERAFEFWGPRDR